MNHSIKVYVNYYVLAVIMLGGVWESTYMYLTI